MLWQPIGEVAACVADQADVARYQRINAIFMLGVEVGVAAAYCGSRSPTTFAMLEAIANGHRDWTSLLDQSSDARYWPA